MSLILDWQPNIALVGEPPLYLSRFMVAGRRKRAWKNAQRLARQVDTLLLDHHLLRCEEGLAWLDRLSSETGHRVICAADFTERSRCLLEKPGASNCTRRCPCLRVGTRPTLTATPIRTAMRIMCLWRALGP